MRHFECRNGYPEIRILTFHKKRKSFLKECGSERGRKTGERDAPGITENVGDYLQAAVWICEQMR
jgi:hypothetical protein